MGLKTYTVNVHYDYVATVNVRASSEEDALILAKKKANDLPECELEYVDFTDACIINIEEE